MHTITLKEVKKPNYWIKREFYYYPQAQLFSNAIKVWFSKN